MEKLLEHVHHAVLLSTQEASKNLYNATIDCLMLSTVYRATSADHQINMLVSAMAGKLLKRGSFPALRSFLEAVENWNYTDFPKLSESDVEMLIFLFSEGCEQDEEVCGS